MEVGVKAFVFVILKFLSAQTWKYEYLHIIIKSLWRTVCCGRDSMLEQGNCMRRRSNRGDVLTTACLASGKKIVSEIELRKEGWGQKGRCI